MITVVTSITSKQIWKNNLKRTLSYQDIPFKLIRANPKLSLFEAYNSIPEIETDFLGFFSQDINLLSKDWLRRAESYLKTLTKCGICGIAGWKRGGANVEGYFVASYGTDPKDLKCFYHGKLYPGRVRGAPFSYPKEVQVLDDMVMLLSKKVWEQAKFDAETFQFHSGGFDYCLQVKYKLGLKHYVLPLPTWENSTLSRTSNYWLKYGEPAFSFPALAKKWRRKVKYVGFIDLDKYKKLEFKYSSFIPMQRKKFKWFRDYILKLPKNTKILECGFGRGEVFKEVEQQGFEIWGVDLHPQLRGHRIKKEDLRETSFEDESFDLVLCLNTVENVGFGAYGEERNLRGDLQALKEFKRVVKRKGLILLSLAFGQPCKKPRNHPFRVYGERELQELIGDLEIVEAHYFLFDKEEKAWREVEDPKLVIENWRREEIDWLGNVFLVLRKR